MLRGSLRLTRALFGAPVPVPAAATASLAGLSVSRPSLLTQPTRASSFSPNSEGGDRERPSVMPFGKYRGRPLEEIPASYAQWLEKEGGLVKREGLRRAFAEMGMLKDFHPYDYSALRASRLNPFVAARAGAPLSPDQIPPFWGAGLAFHPLPAPGSSLSSSDSATAVAAKAREPGAFDVDAADLALSAPSAPKPDPEDGNDYDDDDRSAGSGNAAVNPASAASDSSAAAAAAMTPAAFVPIETALARLSPSAAAALRPFAAVPASLPRHVIFLDTETVYTTAMMDLENSHIAQLGAVDGAGNEFLCDVRPPVPFAAVAAASDWFARHGFERFFSATNPRFADAWPRLNSWLFSPAHGRARCGERATADAETAPATAESAVAAAAAAAAAASEPEPLAGDPALIYSINTAGTGTGAGAAPYRGPVFLIGHNLARFDMPHIDKELRRLGLVNSEFKAGLDVRAPVADARSQLLTHGGVRIIDTLDMLPGFTAVEQSPGRGAWALTNLLHAFTGSPPRNAHDALDDARSLRALFFADNLAGAFFRAELARQIAAATPAAVDFAPEHLPAVATLEGAARGLLALKPAPQTSGLAAAARQQTRQAPAASLFGGRGAGAAFEASHGLGFRAMNAAPPGGFPEEPSSAGSSSSSYSSSGVGGSQGQNGYTAFATSKSGKVYAYNKDKSATGTGAPAKKLGRPPASSYNNNSSGAAAATATAGAAAAGLSGLRSDGPEDGDYGFGEGYDDHGDGDSGSSGRGSGGGASGRMIQPPKEPMSGDFIAE